MQRAVAPAAPTGHGVPLLATAAATTAAAAATAAAFTASTTTSAGTAPRPQPLKRTSAYPPPAVVQRQAVATPRTPQASGNALTVAPPAPASRASVSVQRDLLPTPASTTTAVSHVSAHSVSSSKSADTGSRTHPPAYTAVAKGQFDPRSLTDFQLDELTHRLIGRITRLLRTELRLDRERIGKLRDPRR